MSANLNQPISVLRALPATLPRDRAVHIELSAGALIFRVTETVQERIESLLDKERARRLTPDEAGELEQYEDLDDYLSLLNRLSRNLALASEAPRAA